MLLDSFYRKHKKGVFICPSLLPVSLKQIKLIINYIFVLSVRHFARLTSNFDEYFPKPPTIMQRNISVRYLSLRVCIATVWKKHFSIKDTKQFKLCSKTLR